MARDALEHESGHVSECELGCELGRASERALIPDSGTGFGVGVGVGVSAYAGGTSSPFNEKNSSTIWWMDICSNAYCPCGK